MMSWYFVSVEALEAEKQENLGCLCDMTAAVINSNLIHLYYLYTC